MQTAQLNADTFVVLSCEEEAQLMSGKCIDATQDLGELCGQAKKAD